MPAFAPPPLPLVAIVAVGRNGAIGQNGTLPWHMPSDLARFRALTIGGAMIMGRRTFEAIGRALPDRDSIVLSRGDLSDLPDGVEGAADPDAALALATVRGRHRGAATVALIGGAEVFAAFDGHIDRWQVTLVDLSPHADTFLPLPDPFDWREVARHRPPRGPRDDAACVFLDYERAL